MIQTFKKSDVGCTRKGRSVMQLRHETGVFTRQTTSITPQVIQSLRILQLSATELEDFLREREERNPLIELAGGGGVTRRMPDPGGSGQRGSAAAAEPSMVESRVAATVGLHDHLMHLVKMDFRAQGEIVIAVALVEAIDENGYLDRSLAQIARRLGLEEQQVAVVLARLQVLAPAGVGARSLAECLELQLRERNRFDPAMAALLANLPMLAKYDFKGLERCCGVSLEDIREMAEEVRGLDPRPGRAFDHASTPPALPDVLVSILNNGQFRVELNAALLPKVLVNRQYHAEIGAGTLAAADRRFVVDCMREATWLARNVDHRARTVLGVATEIVARQQDFFRHGVGHLRPLNLSDVADKVGVHVSTVCRAISNKFVQTDRGLFELRFFFSNGLSAMEGRDECSSERVRHRISTLVAAEPVDNVLSDDTIAQRLRDEGIDVARRTVAKYRDMMNIPSSLNRRRQKLVQAMA